MPMRYHVISDTVKSGFLGRGGRWQVGPFLFIVTSYTRGMYYDACMF